MKYLFTLCLLIVSLSGISQWQQTGARVRYVNGLGIPTRDTAAGVAADSSQILIRPADSSLYIKYKRTWVKVGAGGTMGGSGTPNRVSKFTGATTLGNSSIVDSASAVAMTINPSGNVGIGTASPSEKLHLVGNTFRQNDVTNSFGYTISTTSATTTINTIFGGSSFGIRTGGSVSDNMRITSGGNALIGTTTDNGVDRLQVSGNTLSTRYKINTSGQTLEINNYYNTGAGNNIFIGNGGASSTSGNDNLGVGNNALLSVTSGFYNTAIGASSLQSLTTGSRNMALGFESIPLNTTGERNTGIGANALGNSSTGSNNTAVGNLALGAITTTSSNVGIGQESGYRISSGSVNQTSSQSIFIGQDSRASVAGNTNEIVIGHTAVGQGSNTAIIGNSSITKTFLRGSVMVNTTTDNGVDKLQVSGSIQGTGFDQAYLARTTAYTATDTDYLIDCTTGTFTVTLPASSGRTGRILIIKNSGTGTITVDGNASETIDGATTYSLSAQWATIQIMCDGSNWKIIAKF